MITKINDIQLEQVYNLYKNNIKDFVWSEKMLHDDFYVQNHNYLGIIKDGNLVSCISYVNFDEYEILNIATSDKFRKMGYGKELLMHIINQANKEGKNIFLEVNKNNKVAIKFYEDAGFKIINERKNYYKDESALIMILTNKNNN